MFGWMMLLILPVIHLHLHFLSIPCVVFLYFSYSNLLKMLVCLAQVASQWAFCFSGSLSIVYYYYFSMTICYLEDKYDDNDDGDDC